MAGPGNLSDGQRNSELLPAKDDPIVATIDSHHAYRGVFTRAKPI